MTCDLRQVFARMYPNGGPPSHSMSRSDDPGRFPKVSAVLAVDRDGKILVGFSKKRQCWDLPQGVAEAGEAPVSCAIREFREETGVRIHLENLTLVTRFSSVLHRGFVSPCPWTTYIYILNGCRDLAMVHNAEPDKCEELAWRHPSAMPYSRCLSLRVAMELLRGQVG